jgi:hypothetical protein
MSIGKVGAKTSRKATSRLAGQEPASPIAIAYGLSDSEIMEKPAIIPLDFGGVAFELSQNLREMLFQPKRNHPRKKPAVISSLGLVRWQVAGGDNGLPGSSNAINGWLLFPFQPTVHLNGLCINVSQVRCFVGNKQARPFSGARLARFFG